MTAQLHSYSYSPPTMHSQQQQQAPQTPLSPLAMLPQRRVISGLDLYAAAALATPVHGGGLNTPLASYAQGITEGFEVQQGDLDGGGNAADDLQFDYAAGASPEPEEPHTTNTTGGGAVTTPQQAQAELGAMLQDLQRLQQHVAAQSSSSLAQMELSRGDSTGFTFVEEQKSGPGGVPSQAPDSSTIPAPTSPDFNNMADDSPTNHSGGSGGGGADDPLSFPSMNRGASNIQAALDELQSQESNPQQVISPQHSQQQHAQQQLQHMHQQHAQQHSSARQYYSSSRSNNGPPPPLPRELSHSQHSQASVSEYDGEYQHNSQSQYSEHGGESEHEPEGHDSEYAASHYSRQEIDGSKYPQPFSLHITGVVTNGQFPIPQPVTFGALSHHNAYHSGTHGGHHASSHSSHGGHHGSHHSHHHSHHSHSHSHSVAPTVPPVDEDAEDGEVAAAVAAQSARRTQIMQQQQLQNHQSTLLMLDAAYLPSMQSGAHQPHPSSQHLPASLHPGYARSTSASSVTSGRASGGTSPNPGSSSAASTAAARKSPLPPSASASGNTPGTYMLSPTASAPGRRHSGHLERLLPTLHSPSALHPNPHQLQQQQQLPPQREHRMIGRSPSADSLHLAPRPMMPAQPLSGGALSRTNSFTHTLSPSPGPSGSRELHLHPSPSQLQARCEQMQLHHAQQQQQHASSSASPPHSLHIQLHGAAASTASSASSVSSSDHLPGHSLPIGRSFSSDHVHAVKAEHQAYYSDGGYYSQSSSGAVSPVPHAHHSAASAALHRFGLGPQLHLDEQSVLQSLAGGHTSVHHHTTHTHAAAATASSGYASTTSSGAATPLRGPCGSPGALRGSNSMNDLHHLLMLHAQGGERGVTTLLPLKASSHSHTSSHASAAASAGSSDRIGAYTREERARRLARYKDKRQRRCFTKRVLYQVRKDFAVSRKRVGGRFIKKENQTCSCPDVCLETCSHYKPPAEPVVKIEPAAASAASSTKKR